MQGVKITIRVKPGSREDRVEKAGERDFLVKVKAPAREGKANEAVIRTLAVYFDVPPSRVAIVTGAGARQKIVEIGER
jgi:uncharacterized protein (TIGR00251 family)